MPITTHTHTHTHAYIYTYIDRKYHRNTRGHTYIWTNQWKDGHVGKESNELELWRRKTHMASYKMQFCKFYPQMTFCSQNKSHHCYGQYQMIGTSISKIPLLEQHLKIGQTSPIQGSHILSSELDGQQKKALSLSCYWSLKRDIIIAWLMGKMQRKWYLSPIHYHYTAVMG